MRPLDYTAIRKAFVREIERVTGVTCIMARPESPTFPRPSRPYMAIAFVVPGGKEGDDAASYVSGTTWNVGGLRQMTIDFNAYAKTQEEAYELASAWQSALEMETTQSVLRAAGIAVLKNGPVADLSELLQTGYEGRAKLEAEFCVAANVTEDRGAIESATITGDVTTDQGDVVHMSINAEIPDDE